MITRMGYGRLIRNAFRLGYVCLIILFSGCTSSARIENARQNIQKGVLNYKLENYEIAVKLLENGLNTLPKDKIALTYVAKSYEKMHNYKAAVDAWQKYMFISIPNSPQAIAGQELLEKCHALAGSRTDRIISYYSREDVQRAMYQYAQGRKISVLRYFRPMFQGAQLRKLDDILPIMMFYSQEPKLWPSIHGTISRSDDAGRTVCDLVIEVDFKGCAARWLKKSGQDLSFYLNLS